MVSQNTLDIINYTKDLDIEYNTKLILLFTMLIYCLVMFYISFKIKEVKSLWGLISMLLMRWATVPYIFLFFFLLMMVYRGVTLESIFILIMSAYSVLFVICMLLFWVFGFEWVGSFLGIKDLGLVLQKGLKRNLK